MYRVIKSRIETDWNKTIELIEQGIAEGKIKPISIQVLKVMVQATLEQFLDSPVLLEHQIAYDTALKEMLEIIMGGIQK